jgi:hypothetical protein
VYQSRSFDDGLVTYEINPAHICRSIHDNTVEKTRDSMISRKIVHSQIAKNLSAISKTLLNSQRTVYM